MRWKNLFLKYGALLLMVTCISGSFSSLAHGEEVKMTAYYHGFFYGNGWSPEAKDNSMFKAPAGSYMTALKVGLTNQPEGMSGTVAYQVNLSGSGWLDWAENSTETGSVDTEAPLEAVRIRLTGDLGAAYDVYYRVLQSGNWTEWAKNEESAGVEGQGLCVDGIRISIVTKDGPVPEDPKGIDPTRPMVALTFDDGPSSAVTNRILNSLEAHGGRATFFMVGNRVPKEAAVVQRMAALNCEVANHTFEHKYLTDLGDQGIRSSVGQTNSVIANASGVTPRLMRPTGGYYHAPSLATLGSMGMPAVMWSIDTLDWKHRNPQKTIDSVLGQVQDGDIILMHDIYSTTADAAEVIIPELTARGYQLVTVSELAEFRGGMAPGQVYFKFRP